MLGRVLDALIGVLPPEYHDAAFVADVLWLAAASGQQHGSAGEDPSAAADVAAAPAPSASPPPAAALPPPEPPAGRADPAEGARHTPYRLYENHDAQEDTGGARVTVASGRALPQAVELARSLRPFMRRFRNGRRSGLDLAATIDSYSRGGELLPVIGPLPERWFDILLVVDTHLSMEVWHEAVEEFAALLENSGAFRQVQRWRLSTEPHPYVTDAHGRLVGSHGVTSPDGRRLVLVVSDCVAPAWYGAEVWQMLRDWAGRGSLSIANPLPSRLWHRTALDLPAVRVRNRLPGERNTALTYTVPPHLRAVLGDTSRYVAVPTLTLTAHALQRWARGLVRGAPEGYEAVLVTPFGGPESPFTGFPFGEAESPFTGPGGAGGESPFTDPQPPDPPGAGRVPWGEDEGGPGSPDHVRAFLRTASRPAIRLAAICSPFRRLSLPLIQLIRQEVIPEATTSDIAELLMSGVLEIRTSEQDTQLVTFREQARAPLSKIAGRHDAWQVLDALSRYIAERTRLPGRGLNALAALDTDELPESLRPFAYASAEVMAALRAGAERTRWLPADGGPAGAAEARHELPDPAASAALLVGDTTTGSGPGPYADAVVAALDDVAALLTSPDGWNLPPDRCVRLVDPTNGQTRDAIARIAPTAADALLVYVIGHGEGGTERSPGLGTLPGGPVPTLRSLDVAHVVVIQDLCLPAEAEHPSPPPDAGRQSTTWLTARYASAGPPAFTEDLLRTAAEGVPSAPPLLTARALVGSATALAQGSAAYRVSGVREEDHEAAPALVRNRASAPARTEAPSDASVERLLARVLGELRLDETASRVAAAAERVMGTFVGFLAAWTRGRREQGRDAFRGRLESFLAAGEVSVEEGLQFALHCRARDEDPTLVVPVEVLDLSGGSVWRRAGPSTGAALSPDDRLASFAVLVTLGGTRDRQRTALAQRVTVARESGTGTCVVTLHLPVDAPPPDAPPAPRPPSAAVPPPGSVAEAVEAYCASLSERAVAEGWHLRTLLPPEDVVLPEGLTEPLIVSVRPHTPEIPGFPPDDDEGGELHVPGRVFLYGLVPHRNLSSTHNITVLAVENGFAFVSTELAVTLVFLRRPSLPAHDVELLRVEAPRQGQF
ncbi:SAV_2336 N-terminal domain-related protein [Streptomyces sp. NPDC004031]